MYLEDMTKRTNLPEVEHGDLLKPGEASKLIYVTQRTLQRMAERGEIDAIKLPSGHRRYTRESIEAIREGRAA